MLEYNLHKDRDFCQLCPLICFKCPRISQVHGRCSINIIERMKNVLGNYRHYSDTLWNILHVKPPLTVMKIKNELTCGNLKKIIKKKAQNAGTFRK